MRPRPLEPLSSHLPALPTPGRRGPEPDSPPAAAVPSGTASSGSPAVAQGTSPPAIPGRRPAGVPPRPLSALFRFDEELRQVIIALVRPETGRVVRQVPPEKILSLIAHLKEAARRALDRRA